MMHFEITSAHIDKRVDIIDELWRNVSTSPCLTKSINDFGKDFVINSFSSVVNTPSLTPEQTNKFKLPLTLSKAPRYDV